LYHLPAFGGAAVRPSAANNNFWASDQLIIAVWSPTHCRNASLNPDAEHAAGPTSSKNKEGRSEGQERSGLNADP
jgi:hypothetical protein